MPFLPSSRKAGPDPGLPWKIGAFFAGAVLFIAGAAMGSETLIVLAIVVVAAGILIGFVVRKPAGTERQDAEDEVDEAVERRPVQEEIAEADEPKRLIEDEEGGV